MNINARNLLDEILKRAMQKKALTAELEDRLKANFEDIFNYFHRLFPYRNDLREHLEKLVNVLIDNYHFRPSKLRALDSQREQNPSWFTDNRLVGMMLYVDRFAGDLKGLQNKMPYLEELGVNMLHLMPILKCPKDHNDGGYAVSDYRKINPEIGTMEDVRALADQLHDKDMLIMMDFVLNHTSDEHEWAKKAKAGDAKYQAYYHTFDDRTVPDRYEETLPEVFPDTSPGNFTHSPEMNKWVMTVFNNYQWDLNYSNPEVFIEMCDALLFLSNQGIDILRLDALAFMWKKTGTISQNLDEAHLLIKALKSCMKVSAPATVFLAEAIVAPEEIVKYFGQVKNGVSDECDLCYNATLMVLLWEAICTKNNKLLWVTLNNIPGKPMGASWLNYVRCHDDIGLGYEDEHARMTGSDPSSHRRFIIDFLTGKIEWSFARGRPFMEDKVKGDARISGSLASLAGLEKALYEHDSEQRDLAVKKILMLHGIVLSYGGIPMLYTGDELATLNDYSFENDPSKSADNRWMHRPKMDWKIAEKRNIKGTHEHQVFHGLKKMIRVRAESPEFADKGNTYLFDCHNQHLLAFSRILDNRKTLVVCNLNDHPEIITSQIPDYMHFDPSKAIYDKISEKTLNFKSAGLKLKPYEILWITQ
ncbi:MAG: alpha-amylase family protein [Cyclobacteriaceae bacterium]